MRISRVEIESGFGTTRSHEFARYVAAVSESPADTERLLAVFRNLYLGLKRGSKIFAVVDDIEIEVTNDMLPLIGQRLGGQFNIVDLALPPTTENEPVDIRDVQAVVARAALETVGAIPATLDLARLEQAAVGIDQYRDPLADLAHTAHLRRSGLRQLFSRRSGRELLESDDPTVLQLSRLQQTLTHRRRQLSASAAPLPQEFSHATNVLRELVSARTGGMPEDMAASMSPEAIERDVMQWVAQQHDRMITPVVAEACERHAVGIDVLGSIPMVIDMRRVEGLPPGSDALRWAARRHADNLQFIVLVGGSDNRRWIETTFDSSPAS